MLKKKFHENDFQSVLFALLSELFSISELERGEDENPLQDEKRLYNPKTNKEKARIDIIMLLKNINFIFEMKYTNSGKASYNAVRQILGLDRNPDKTAYAYTNAFQSKPFSTYERVFLFGINVFPNLSVQISYLWTTGSNSGSFDQEQIRTIGNRFDKLPEAFI